MRASHFQKLAIDTYESRGVAGNPGDEDDLASIIGNRSVERTPHHKVWRMPKSGVCVPFALTTAEVVLNVVDSVTGSGTALAILGSSELLPENLVVLVVTDGVDNNILLVIGDLEDDVLGLALAHTEVVECRQALVLDGNTANRNINLEFRENCERLCR